MFLTFYFTILFVGINLPNVRFVKFPCNGTNRRNRRQHTVIHIVIAVLTIAPDTVKIFYIVKRVAQFGNIFVGVEIRGISLWNFHAHAKLNVRRVDNANRGEFVRGEFYKVVIAHLPEFVTFAAEIFQSDPHRILRIGNEIRRPVIKNLQTPQLNRRFLNINPTVGNDIAERFNRRMIF